MSRPVDDKIVKLSMDNSDFQSKATQSASIISKLMGLFSKPKNLNLDKSISALQGVSDKAKGVTLDRLSEAANTVGGRFTNLGVVATTALMNITNRAVDAGINLAKSLTLDQITSGFGEYELKMKSIQTILSNTQGKSSLQDVTSTLDELNTYADKTIYNFAEMTSNIGTFTAAGVGLKDSATAIKGISNLAAASGSNSQQASTAMYQLSQALASGSVKLQDWNSVVNAGMGGKLFQNALLETANNMGIANSGAKNFRESLQEGWLTTDVLIATLDRFSKDQSMLEAATKVRTFTAMVDTAKEAIGSGWAQTWEIMVGNFEEAGNMWTAANDVLSASIGKSADARNKLLKGFVDLGGRARIIDIVSNSFKALTTVMDVVGEAWRNVFPPVTSQGLYDIVKGLADFTKGLNPTLAGTVVIRDVFQDVFGVFKNLASIIGTVAGAFKDAFVDMFPSDFGGKLSDITGAIKTFSDGLLLSGEQGEKIKTVFKGAIAIFQAVATIAIRLGQTFLKLIPEGTGDGILDLLVWIAELALKFNESVQKGNAFKTVIMVLSGAFTAVNSVVGIFMGLILGLPNTIDLIINSIMVAVDWIGKKLGQAFDAAGKKVKANDIFNGVLSGGIAALAFMFKDFKNVVSEVLEDFAGNLNPIGQIKDTLGKLGDALDTFVASVKINMLLKIAGAIGILAASLFVLSTIDPKDAIKALEMMGVSMVILTAGFKSVTATISAGKGGLFGGAAAIMAIATSLLIMSGALAILSRIEPEKLATGLAGLAGTMLILVGGLKLLTKAGKLNFSTAISLQVLANSILVLTGSLVALSMLNPQSLIQGLLGLGAVFLEIAVFTKLMNKSKLSPATALGVAVVSGAILSMSASVIALGTMDSNTLIKGLATMGGMLLEIAIFAKMTGGSQIMTSAAGMAILSGAIAGLAPALVAFGNMSWESIGKAMVTLGGALGILAIGLKAMQSSLAGSLALSVAAVAINLLIVPLAALGAMSWDAIVKGLVAIGGAFVVVGGASMILSGATATLIPFSLGIAAVGLAIAGIGLSLLGFTSALATLATLTAGSIMVILTNLKILLDGVTQLIPSFVNFIVVLVTSMARGFSQMAPSLFASFMNLVIGLLTVATEKVPMFIDIAVQFIVAMATALGDNAETLITAGVELIVKLVNGLANGIRDNSEQIVTAVLNITEAILEIIIDALAGIVDVLFGWIPGVSDATKGLGDAAKEGLRERFNIDETGRIAGEGADAFVGNVGAKAGAANTAGKSLGTNARDGAAAIPLDGTGTSAGSQFVGGLNSKVTASRLTGKGLAGAGKDGAGGVSFNTTGSTAGGQWASGLGSKTGASRTSGRSLGTAGKGGAESVDMSGAGRNFGEGFATGIESKQSRVSGAASWLAGIGKSALEGFLKIFSPSRELRKDGGHFGEGFALGIEDKGSRVAGAGTELGKTAMDGVTKISDTINSVLEDNLNYEPKIIPTLDLSNLGNIPDLSRNMTLKGNFSQYTASVGVTRDTLDQSASKWMQSPDGIVTESPTDTKLDSVIALLQQILEAMSIQPIFEIIMDGTKVAGVVQKPLQKLEKTQDTFFNKLNGVNV